MSKYDVLIGLLLIIMTTSIFGGVVGFEVDGEPRGLSKADSVGYEGNYINEDGVLVNIDGLVVVDLVGSDPNIITSSLDFFWSMVTFRVDGVPFWISGIFLIMNLMMLYLLYNAIRGNG